ncbi:MAG: hypothetical protein GY757_12480 [bacterium]|nr:hypothetical protein [bacterium]
MKSKNILKILLVAGFFFLQVYLVFFKEIQVLDYPRTISEFPLSLHAKGNRVKEVAQTFRTPGPLARIDIMLANYKVKPKSGILQLDIFKDYKATEILFRGKYPATTVEDNQFYRFAIDENHILSKDGETLPAGDYILRLYHFPEDKKERLAVWMYKKNIYPYGRLIVNGREKRGDMTFRVYFYSTLWGYKSSVLKKIPSVWFGGFWLSLAILIMFLALNLVLCYFVNKM